MIDPAELRRLRAGGSAAPRQPPVARRHCRQPRPRLRRMTALSVSLNKIAVCAARAAATGPMSCAPGTACLDAGAHG